MHLLQSGVPFSDIALSLGHESPNATHRYVEANLKMNEIRAIRIRLQSDHRMRKLASFNAAPNPAC